MIFSYIYTINIDLYMKAYIIIIGDEILSGRTLDTNSNFIVSELDKIGISTFKIVTIPDQVFQIKNQIEDAFASEANFIFTTGGLGPTKDDKTKQVITDFLNDTLVLHQPSLDYIKQIYYKNNRVMNPLTYNQAMVPSKSEVIINKYGTAPILWTLKDSKLLINLPGVPYETCGMLNEVIIPKIKNDFQLDYIIRESAIVIDIPESELAIKLENWENNLPEFISLAYLPSGSRIELRLTAIGKNKIYLQNSIQNEINKLNSLLGKNLIISQTTRIEEIIGNFLIKNNLTISVAESLTGGAISKKITSISGSSRYYKGGITAYSKEAKKNVLMIKEEILKENNIVSETIAKEMVIHCSSLFNSDISISTTGVAGPNSDEFNNPVGLAFVGIYYKGDIVIKKYLFPNLTREEMIARITYKSLESLYFKFIDEENS